MIATELRRLRHEAALSQRDLAERAGVTQTTIVKAEAGGELRPSTLRKLAAALEVKPVELVRGSSPTPAAPRRAAMTDGDRAATALAQLLAQAEHARARGDDEAAARFEAMAAGMAARNGVD